MKRAALLLLASAGCSFSAGEPYGQLSLELDARYALRADRDRGEGWQQLASEYALRLSRVELVVEAVDIVGTPEEGPAPAFDPGHPPPGYDLCHNGHCHDDDGGLVDYEEIAAELAGGDASSHTVLTFRPGTVDALGPEATPLPCPGACVLGRGHLTRARVVASRLRVIGEVRDDRGRIAGSRAIAGDLPLSGDEHAIAPGRLEAALDLPLSDEHPSQIALNLGVPLSAELFDGVPFANLPLDPEGRLDLNHEAASHDIEARFAELSLAAHATRSDP